MGSEADYYDAIEGNTMLGTSEEGSIVPHTVSAFLYDLTDTRAETHDTISYPGSYVATILKTCMWQLQGQQFLEADGIDHIIWCLEGSVDPSITGDPSYFPTRSWDPWGISESAAEPIGHSQSAIRGLWMANLYPN
jgi:hypothetical protein